MTRPAVSSAATQLPGDFRRRIACVVIGASAGGIEALVKLLAPLPPDYPLPIVVLLHLPDEPGSLLADLFATRCKAPVREAMDKMAVEPGITVAPSGYHLLVEGDRTFALSCDAPVRFSRPSIDVLFESAADAYGPALAAVLLTGANDDGARGLVHAADAGALTVVQSPASAQQPEMPSAAIALREPDFILPLEAIARMLTRLEAVQ